MSSSAGALPGLQGQVCPRRDRIAVPNAARERCRTAQPCRQSRSRCQHRCLPHCFSHCLSRCQPHFLSCCQPHCRSRCWSRCQPVPPAAPPPSTEAAGDAPGAGDQDPDPKPLGEPIHCREPGPPAASGAGRARRNPLGSSLRGAHGGPAHPGDRETRLRRIGSALRSWAQTSAAVAGPRDQTGARLQPPRSTAAPPPRDFGARSRERDRPSALGRGEGRHGVLLAGGTPAAPDALAGGCGRRGPARGTRLGSAAAGWQFQLADLISLQITAMFPGSWAVTSNLITHSWCASRAPRHSSPSWQRPRGAAAARPRGGALRESTHPRRGEHCSQKPPLLTQGPRAGNLQGTSSHHQYILPGDGDIAATCSISR